ncbi:MAG: PQQ-dependent sugar dehydrogenase [Bacteroidota bacterium]
MNKKNNQQLSRYTQLGCGILLVFSLLALKPVFFSPTGIDTPAPIEPFLNGKLPAETPTGLGAVEVVPAFPNLSFSSPIALVQHPHADTLLVAQRSGQVYAFPHDPETSDKSLFMNIWQKVGLIWDAGLLGFALHPNFGLEGMPGSTSCFVYYTSRDSSGGHQPDNWENGSCEGRWYGSYLVLSRWELAEGSFSVDPGSEQLLFRIRAYNASHRGGGLTFGQDGHLYVSIGDQYRNVTAQDLVSNLDGGVLRLDVDQDSSRSHTVRRKMPEHAGQEDELTGNGYLIPNDNPFLNTDGNSFEEYFTVGHRAPHRLTMDPFTGNLYVGEVGLFKREELNKIVKGGNYGWPLYEGTLKHTTNYCSSKSVSLDSGLYTPPLVEYFRDEANSLIGGYVYRGNKIPALYGKYISGCYYQHKLYAVDLTNGTKELIAPFQPRYQMSFGQDRAGEIYLLAQGGRKPIYTLQASEGGEAPPQWLSETAVFQDLDKLIPAEGVLPYAPHVPFWSDGAVKKRWVAIPNDGVHDSPEEQIQFERDLAWRFPLGSVFIKHFDYPIQTGQGTEYKKLETRFLVHGADSQYYALSYHWLPDGSDAQLFLSGKKETFAPDLTNPNATITWSYPSVADCGSCHSSGNGMILGMNVAQMNSEYQYPQSGRSAHQLLTFKHLGILNFPDLIGVQFPQNYPLEDRSSTLEQRARSYLDANCAYCHQPANPNRAVFDARLGTPLEEQNLIYGQLTDALGIDSAYVIVPGDADRSVLYRRLSLANHEYAMPPLAKNLVDTEGAELVRAWIESLNPADFEPPVLADPMELEWGEFTALPGAAVMHISWNTYLENSVATFQIQFSRDEQLYEDLLEVVANGTPGTQTFYTNPHAPLSPGRYVYRVIAHGKDGTTRMSQTFSAWIESQEAGLWLYPNPYDRSGSLSLEIQLPTSADAELHMTNVQGQEIWRRKLQDHERFYQLSIAPIDLSPGLYLMHLRSGNWHESKKIWIE